MHITNEHCNHQSRELFRVSIRNAGSLSRDAGSGSLSRDMGSGSLSRDVDSKSLVRDTGSESLSRDAGSACFFNDGQQGYSGRITQQVLGLPLVSVKSSGLPQLHFAH